MSKCSCRRPNSTSEPLLRIALLISTSLRLQQTTTKRFQRQTTINRDNSNKINNNNKIYCINPIWWLERNHKTNIIKVIKKIKRIRLPPTSKLLTNSLNKAQASPDRLINRMSILKDITLQVVWCIGLGKIASWDPVWCKPAPRFRWLHRTKRIILI